MAHFYIHYIKNSFFFHLYFMRETIEEESSFAMVKNYKVIQSNVIRMNENQ